MYSTIKGIGYYIPKNKITSLEIENEIAKSYSGVHFGIIEELTGVKTRYFVDENEYSSDLAIKASINAIKNSGISKEEIDLIIFASASQDITEPATANIVQKGLSIKCPVFDVKNACNSFMNGLDIADSFIKSGKYKNILICSGETPSKAIKYDIKNKEEFKNHFAAYTFGDAGSAVIMTGLEEKKGILFSYFYSDGDDWDTATIMGGGGRFPRDNSKSYFAGDASKIRDKFISLDALKFEEGLKALSWKKEEIKKVFVHQVAMSNFDYMYKNLGISKDKFKIILPELGNIASCCIITSLAKSFEENELKTGDNIIFLGFASGFSYSIIFYEV